MNTSILVGRLGQDVRFTAFENGNRVANFSLATNRKWTDKATNEKREATEWHNIVAWGGLADVCKKYLAKGSQVAVQGELRYREYETQGKDCKTGQLVNYGDGTQMTVKVKVAEIIADDVKFLDKKPTTDGYAPTGQAVAQAAANPTAVQATFVQPTTAAPVAPPATEEVPNVVAVPPLPAAGV